MDPLRQFVSVVLMAGSFGLVAPSVSRGDEGAQAFVMDRQSQVTALLHLGPSPERDRLIAEVLDSMMDYDEVAERSLSTHWDELSPAQRDEFTVLLTQLVRRSFERNMSGILDWHVQYLTEEPASPGLIVYTRATSVRDPRVEPVTI